MLIRYNTVRKAGGMDKVGNAVMKVARSRGEIVPKDFAAAVKDIKLAILQSRARAAHASQTSLAPVIEGVLRCLGTKLLLSVYVERLRCREDRAACSAA